MTYLSWKKNYKQLFLLHIKCEPYSDAINVYVRLYNCNKVLSESDNIFTNEYLEKELLKHRGHKIYIACYGDPEYPMNVSLECEDCHKVIIDTGIYTLAPRTDID